MNKVILIGRLTKDPELKYTQSNTAVASFTLAVDRTYKNAQGERQADFIPVVTWRKTAELCVRYLSKGAQVGICGKLQTRSYEAQDGTKRNITEVIVEDIQFINSSKKVPQNESDSLTEGNNDILNGFDVINESELPF